MRRAGRVIGALVALAAAFFATPALATARATSCLTRAAATPTCTLTGTVSGSYGNPSKTYALTWTGMLDLKERFVDPITHQADDRPVYAVVAPSEVTWQITGSDAGCTVSGGGTVNATQLVGDLQITGWNHAGQWVYSLGVGPLIPMSGPPTMPVTYSNCTGGGPSYTVDFSAAQGMIFGYNSYALNQPAANVQTDGRTFSGSILTQPGNQSWAWSVTGAAFADAYSEHAVTFIKREEALAKRCGHLICVYNDQTQNCTIGWGYLLHLGPCTRRDGRTRWTRQEAETKLRERLTSQEEPWVRGVSRAFGLNQCQFDALMSFAYNTSTASHGSLIRGLSGDPNSGVNYFQYAIPLRLMQYTKSYDRVTHKWVQLRALERRRAAEARQFEASVCPCAGSAF
jgi:GH24 family phage-related lysozyme (muramidase)